MLTKDNMTPKIYGGFDFGVYHSVVMEGKTEELSFTDQSLRAVRLMATTQEDQVEPLDHADHDMDGEHDFDEELIYDPDNLHAFQAFPGDQNWWIFRPDPGNTGRCEAISMRVTAETTMREIEENLIRMPDLQPGRPDWVSAL